MKIDLALNVKLAPLAPDFEKGIRDFLNLLHSLERLPIFNMGWMAHNCQLWAQEAGFHDKFKEENSGGILGDDQLVVRTISPMSKESDLTYYFFEQYWQTGFIDHLSGEIHHPHPDYGLQPQNFINMIDIITQWKRPQHLRFGPFIYMRDHHPLDRAREGIGWMGWVPFALNPSDVPEAALVREMNGGTLIVTQMEFWQAWPAHPDYSKTAIERAQEVEVRLNLLGVLPTVVELQRGDWGQ